MMHDRAALWILCETLLTQILSCSDATLCSSQRILDHQYKSRVYWSGVNSQCTSSQVFFSLELICNCSHVSWLPPQHFFWLKEIKKMSYLWCNVKQICSFVDLTKNLHSTNFDMFGINILEVSPEDFIFFFFCIFGSELHSRSLQNSPEQPKVSDLLLWRILFLWESCRISETSRAPYCAKVLLLFCVCWPQRGKMVSVSSSVFVYWQINHCAVRISHTSQAMWELLLCFVWGWTRVDRPLETQDRNSRAAPSHSMGISLLICKKKKLQKT